MEFEVTDTAEVQHVIMVDEEKPVEKAPESGKPGSNPPKTGDNTNVRIWLILLAMSMGGLGVIAGVRRKKK